MDHRDLILKALWALQPTDLTEEEKEEIRQLIVIFSFESASTIHRYLELGE